MSDTLRKVIEKAASKVSKADANYSKGMPNAHCGICQHYLGGSCEIVAGKISPDMWCKYFLRKP